MAKKVTKAAPKLDNELADKVSRLCTMAELYQAAVLVRDSKPSEADFDAIMAANPGLREVFIRL